MSVKVDDASPYDGDPEVLQTATLRYPFTFPTNGSTITSAELAYRMPPPTAVRLADGRVLHCQVTGYEDTSRYARGVYLLYADDETTYCTTHNSLDWDTRMLLFDTGAAGHANVVASISRLNAETLILVVTSDCYGIALRCGDGSTWSPAMSCMAYDSTNSQMYGFGYSPYVAAYVERLWSIDPLTAEATALQREYNEATYNSVDYGFTNGSQNHTPVAYVASTDTFYRVVGADLETVDLATGAPTTVGATTLTGGTHRGMSYDSTNSIMYGNTASNLYTVNLATGAWTLVGAAGPTTCKDIEYDSAADVLYGIASDTLYTVNRATGAWTSVGSTGTTNTMGLGYDVANDFMYGSSHPIVGTGDDETHTPQISRVNRGTGGFFSPVDVPKPNPVWPWSTSLEGVAVYHSTDDGLTWRGGYGYPATDAGRDDYATLSVMDAYDSAWQPGGKQGFVASPTHTSNSTWANTANDCIGNNGIVYQMRSGRVYVTAHFLRRDQTFTTSYNTLHPCLLRIAESSTEEGYYVGSFEWPAFNQIDTAVTPAWYEAYGEGESPDWDWLTPPATVPYWDHNFGGNTHSTRSHWASANLFEHGTDLFFTTSRSSDSSDFEHRLWVYNTVSTEMTWMANTPDYHVTWYRCADKYLDGALVWIRSGAATGGLWVGRQRDEPITNPAVQTQLVAGTGVDIRIQGAIHQGCDYVWSTWALSTSSGSIGIRAVLRDPCDPLPPFEFPHPLHDVFDAWDRGDRGEAAALLDRNNDAIEELLSQLAICGVPDYPHPWGRTVLDALHGDMAARDAWEDQQAYLTVWFSTEARYARTPWVFTTSWDDALTQWGRDMDVDAAVEAMWDHYRSWQTIAADPPITGLCDGTNTGLWKL